MYRDIGRDVFAVAERAPATCLTQGNAADNTAIRELLLEYVGDLPMLDAQASSATAVPSRLASVAGALGGAFGARASRHPPKAETRTGLRAREAGMGESSAPTRAPPFVREELMARLGAATTSHPLDGPSASPITGEPTAKRTLGRKKPWRRAADARRGGGTFASGGGEA